MAKKPNIKAGVSCAIFALLLSSACQAGILGSKHDLSTSGGGTIKSTNQTELCIFCHTPHDALKNDSIPLWNHTLSSTGSYGVYASPTMEAVPVDVGNGGTLSSATVTNLCLSCHDGTTAVNALNNPSNATPVTTMAGGVDKITGTANLGSAVDALKNDHPVNFTYDAALVTSDGSTGLKDPSTLAGVKLFGGKVQCATCHNVHGSADPSGLAFLRVSMTGSALCFACHSK